MNRSSFVASWVGARLYFGLPRYLSYAWALKDLLSLGIKFAPHAKEQLLAVAILV